MEARESPKVGGKPGLGATGDRRGRGPSGVNRKAKEVTRRALPHAQLAERTPQPPSSL